MCAVHVKIFPWMELAGLRQNAVEIVSLLFNDNLPYYN